MRRFLVGFLATIGVLTLLVTGAVAVAVWWLIETAPELPDRMVVTLDLREGIPEAGSPAPLAALGLPEAPTLADLVVALDQAGRDPRVKGLLARLDGGGPGLAQIQELRAGLARFRERGKFAYAYADSFGEFGPGTGGYYLATAFDQVHLQPMGSLGLTGILIETPLLRGLLDWLGVDPSIDKRGPYKSAANMFTEKALTPEHRESLESIADSLDRQIRGGIAEGRGMTEAEVQRWIDSGPHSAAEAQAAGLVDRLSYWNEVVEAARTDAGDGSELMALAKYGQALDPPPEDAPVLALIRGVGQIRRGDSESGPIGSWVMGADTLGDALAAAIEDPEVTAILFRIDSGGGSAIASETIGHQVRRAIEAGKPVIVSMGDAAASGGYWIAMDATKIVAEPGTLTGSIGVFAGKPVLAELWDNVGVSWGRVARGANATMWSTSLEYSARGRARLESFLDQVYQAFTEGVARGRGLPEAEVLEIAQGRVWTGEQALELGLVDELGGFADALELAREAAGIAPDQPVELRPFPKPLPPWEQALELLGDAPLGIDTLRPLLTLLHPGALTAPPILIR